MDRRLSRVEVIPVLLEEIASEINLRIARLADMGFLGAEGLRKEREKTSQMYDISPDPESVASEIRAIQRRGRVGRLVKGKIIFLITKKTRDESYYWSSKSKERTMKRTLYAMKEESKQVRIDGF